MNILPMQYFLKVVNEKGISRAAEQLHITQQALSGHMNALEKELGCTLFRRRPDFQLTYAGQIFYDYASRFDRLYRSMQAQFHDIARDDRGEFCIGITPMRGRYLLPLFLEKYRILHPNICIRITESTNEDLVNRLLEKRIDLFIANIPEEIPLITTMPFLVEEPYLYVPSALLSPEKRQLLSQGDFSTLSDCPFLLTEPTSKSRKLIDTFFEKHNIMPHAALISKSTEILLDLCLAGKGACFCTKQMADKIFAGKDISHLLCIPINMKLMVRLAILKNIYISRPLQDFIDLCLQKKAL